MRRVSVAAFVAALSSMASADVVTLSALRDATLYEDPAGLTANGAGQYLFTGRTNNASIRRGLVQFDLSGIQAGATITSVTLTLHYSQGGAADQVVSMHRALSAWTTGASDPDGNEGGGTGALAGDCTWLHSSFDSTFWNNAGGDFDAFTSASATIGANFGFYSWSGSGLVADVQSWVNGGASNFGWFLLGPEVGVGTTKRFDSSENPVGDFRPVLTVEYAVPGPAAWSLLAAALLAPSRRSRKLP